MAYAKDNFFKYAGFTYYYSERVLGQLLPNNTSMINIILNLLKVAIVFLGVHNSNKI